MSIQWRLLDVFARCPHLFIYCFRTTIVQQLTIRVWRRHLTLHKSYDCAVLLLLITKLRTKKKMKNQQKLNFQRKWNHLSKLLLCEIWLTHTWASAGLYNEIIFHIHMHNAQCGPHHSKWLCSKFCAHLSKVSSGNFNFFYFSFFFSNFGVSDMRWSDRSRKSELLRLCSVKIREMASKWTPK